ncbi:MAG TPA: hypothetical protein VGQ27_14845 [Steroidobacteraceae bacterium]|nr:hypothetical protein [Steroidobacteraceae bacterium]
MPTPKDWKLEVDGEIASLALPEPAREEFLRENIGSIAQVIAGLGPDDSKPKPGAGARVVFNMSCTHVPDFCKDSAAGPDAYKNAYKFSPSRKRVAVDEAVETCSGDFGSKLNKEDICFGAVETSGTGIRFYGDLCLVLKPTPEQQDLLLIDRNSYDVARNPIAERVRKATTPSIGEPEARVAEMLPWLGRWADLAHMLAMKIIRRLPLSARRWTTGQIAQAVLEDEDYCEVLYPKSFNAGDLAEVRVSAPDAAAESDIAHREQAGEAPSIHELAWRDQRRDARRALVKAKVPVRVVTTPGRLKGS